MAQMISAQHGVRCTYGCCGTLPAAKYLGKRRSEAKTATKRALKKRDRQNALKGES